jgi:hypothetical protein
MWLAATVVLLAVVSVLLATGLGALVAELWVSTMAVVVVLLGGIFAGS